MEQKSYALSLKDADALIAMEDKPARHGLRAQIFNKMGHIDKANNEERDTIAKFDQEIALHSNQAEKFSERGEVYESFGKYKSAANDYLAALRLKPDSSIYLSSCARAFCKAGDYQNAIDYFTRALAADNKFGCKRTHNYSGLAEAHLALGQPELAILDCNKALTVDESEAAAYHWRALAYEKLGNKERAKADARHAENLDFTPDPEIE